jgi:hypothetical protein
VEDLIGVFGQGDAFQLRRAGLVKQADLDLGCICGEQGEVGAFAVPSGTSGEREPLAEAVLYYAGQCVFLGKGVPETKHSGL